MNNRRPGESTSLPSTLQTHLQLEHTAPSLPPSLPVTSLSSEDGKLYDFLPGTLYEDKNKPIFLDNSGARDGSNVMEDKWWEKLNGEIEAAYTKEIEAAYTQPVSTTSCLSFLLDCAVKLFVNPWAAVLALIAIFGIAVWLATMSTSIVVLPGLAGMGIIGISVGCCMSRRYCLFSQNEMRAVPARAQGPHDENDERHERKMPLMT